MQVEEDNRIMRKRAAKNSSDVVIRAQGDNVEYESKARSNGRRQIISCGRCILMTCLLSLLGLLILAVSGIDSTPSDFVQSKLKTSSSSEGLSAATAPPPKKDWSQCITYNHKSAGKSRNATVGREKTEPLWLPAYPTSLPGKSSSIYSLFLSALTGIDSASRNYYRSSKKLKRCHYLNSPDDMGVTCEIVHPIVPCERPHPSAQSDNFGKVVLVGLRNPITAFPAYQQEKAEKYHNANSQVEKSEWITFRDQWVGNATHSPLFDEWKNFIMEWRRMKPYSVAMYLPYEWWSDDEKGPALVKRFAEILKSEGLPVLYETNSNSTDGLDCIWYKEIREAMQAVAKKRQDIGWYDPDYRPEQKQLLAMELNKFAEEIKNDNPLPGDEELINILGEYSDSILKITSTD